jgi:DNA invertase Pin-like site-specific DNA recombinase
MSTMLAGYARGSTDGQDLTVQRDALAALGVRPSGSTSTTG